MIRGSQYTVIGNKTDKKKIIGLNNISIFTHQLLGDQKTKCMCTSMQSSKIVVINITFVKVSLANAVVYSGIRLNTTHNCLINDQWVK